jgi:hypothetical protein
MVESGKRGLELEGESLGKLTPKGWKRLEDLQGAVASLEAETSRWREVTQVRYLPYKNQMPNVRNTYVRVGCV